MHDHLIQSPLTRFAVATPEHQALSFRGEAMSYAELDRASNRLAHALINDGLVKGDRVGIFMPKSLELGVAIYGILKAGGVFVPIDPLIPKDHLAFIIEDCEIAQLIAGAPQMRALLTLDADLRPKIYGPESRDEVPTLSWEEQAGLSSEAPAVELIDLDLGYIMYTSGSTGRPKGMMHSHRGSLSYSRWGRDHVQLTSADRVASHAPLHFDLSIFDFFSTLQAGATVVLVPEAVTKFPASWTQYVDDEGISVVFTVPYTLIEMLERGVMEQRDLSSLRWLLYGGEPFPPKHLRRLMEALPEVRVTNVYGPAEAPSCTCYDLPGPPMDDEPIPIGLVSTNSEDLIVDEEGETVPEGEPGELCIRSSTLTRGYWKRPDLNARVYLERPSAGPFPDIYFRTGDLVQRHADGQLRFLGRSDRMVKVRGHRIELDGLEAAMAQHPAVQEAAMLTLPDAQGSKVIVLAATLHEPGAADEAELQRHARATLPSYAQPQTIKILPDLPRTSSGKVDRLQLRDRTFSSES